MAKNLGLELTSSVADGGVAHILDTATAFTSGTILSVREGGSELLSLNHAGDLDISSTTASTSTTTGSGIFAGGVGIAGALVQGATIHHIGSTTNAKMTTGLTIKQPGTNDEGLAIKSTSIDHKLTSQAETDTYANMRPDDSTRGGFRISGFAEDDASADASLAFQGYGGTADTGIRFGRCGVC